MQKLRVLSLHGYRGSGEVLRQQMRAWAAPLSSRVELVCVDAPSLASGDFGWWHAVDGHCRGWSRTRDWLEELIARAGPFDGVFGFSQGAALAALLVGLCGLELNFAILVGGFVSSDAEHAPLYEALAERSLPSLHIIGRSDAVVPARRSHALAAKFDRPQIVEHDGGHVIASTPAILRASEALLARPNARRLARRPLEIPLWRDRAHPAMRVVLPDHDRDRRRPALLVLRGGGYHRSDGSGGGTAEWAAAHGMVGVEVEYGTRSTDAAYPANYADAARAVRLVRQRAAEWGIDPARVGVIGYSAGGHLASLLSTQPSLPSPDDELAGSISARPDLVALAYPLISFVDRYSPGAFVGSVEGFFGRSVIGVEERRRFSSELHVEAGHPPVFIWTTADDALVPASHAQRFVDACRRAQVPVTFKLFAHGPHGMGLALDEPGDVREWTALFLAWLHERWGPLD
jgi:acetyl esterase/lipase